MTASCRMFRRAIPMVVDNGGILMRIAEVRPDRLIATCSRKAYSAPAATSTFPA